jgi:hypothetical protein
LEDNSGKPRGLTKNRHSDSLKKGKLTQGMVKKGDVAVDDDDGAVRTRVYQTKVTVDWVLRNSSSGIGLQSSIHIANRQKWGGGRKWTIHTPLGPVSARFTPAS